MSVSDCQAFRLGARARVSFSFRLPAVGFPWADFCRILVQGLGRGLSSARYVCTCQQGVAIVLEIFVLLARTVLCQQRVAIVLEIFVLLARTVLLGVRPGQCPSSSPGALLQGFFALGESCRVWRRGQCFSLLIVFGHVLSFKGGQLLPKVGIRWCRKRQIGPARKLGSVLYFFSWCLRYVSPLSSLNLFLFCFSPFFC